MKLKKIPIEKISLKHYNLRFNTQKERLQSLEESIKNHGLLVPLIISEKGQMYELVSGHRRLEVLKKLGYKEVPVIIIDDLPPDDFVIKSIVENVERVDLTPVERGFAYAELYRKFKIPIREIAKKVSRSKTEVSLFVRVVEGLDTRVREAFHKGEISYSHARELLRIKDKKEQLRLFRKIIDEDWTIERTAVEVNLALPQEKLKEKEKKLNIIELKVMKKLGKRYGKDVHFKQGKKKERMMIDYEDEIRLKELMTEILQVLE